MESISFTVAGTPRQRGSKRAMPNPAGGRPLMVDDNAKSKPWMAAVASAASDVMNGAPLLEGPLRIVVTFWFKRPKSHYLQRKTGAVLRDDAPTYHASKPDADKSMRAIGDALTGVVYRDDSQLAEVFLSKHYTASSEGAEIKVKQLNQEESVDCP